LNENPVDRQLGNTVMKTPISDQDNAVVAQLKTLIALRPDRKITGFAPGGRVSTHQFGTNRSVFTGRGMEFEEARIYQPGDDVRSIDWRVTARTGKVHTKLYREERERPVYILLDCRSMMHFGTRVRFKSVLAAQLAAQLCWVGIDGGDRVGGFILTQNGHKDFPATRTRQGMLGFLNAVSKATHTSASSNTDETPLHMAVRRLRHTVRPGSLVFIISDFSDFDDACEAQIKRLSVHGHVTNIQVYDALDIQLPGSGDLRITNGHDMVSLASLGRAQLKTYKDEFAGRQKRLEKMCAERGMALHTLTTSDDPKSILMPLRHTTHGVSNRRIAA